MSRHNLDDIIKSPFQYFLGKKHYYLIEEYDVLCDFADTYKETKRVELTEEELGYLAECEKKLYCRKEYGFVLSAERKIRKVLDNEKEK